MFQSYSSLPASIWWMPCAYATIFDAYSACSTWSANALRLVRAERPSPSARQPRGRRADRRGPDSERANTASAIPHTGTPRSSAIWTVQRPVPFCSAWSSTTSTKGLPVARRCTPSTSAVISIRYESSRPGFQVRNTSAICAGD